ncbi:MAG: hypothetical protein AB1938_23555 [Myxococcota bacterium]
MHALKKLLMVAALAAFAASTSGCLSSRLIRSVAQSGDKNVTLVETYDRYTYIPGLWFSGKHQFWKCSEVPGTMTCQKVCEAKDSDLTCPGIGAFAVAGDNAVK